MIITELQWITYLSLVALGIVTYLYIRQRNENNQRLRNYLQEPDYYPVTTKPGPDSLNRSFPGPGQSVPPFSQQDGFQRRPVNDFDIRNPNQSILRTTSPFDDVNVSRLDNKSRDFDQSRITDRSFERKYIPYEPSREVGSYQPVSRQEQPVSHDKPHWSRIDSSISEIVTYPAANGNTSKEIVYTKEEIIEENPIPVDRRENRRNLDEDPIHNYPELENEYKVFKDLKLREGRRFHDEPKKDGSPMRPGKRMSALDRVGHSPDSPFKMFESPANSKKKLNGNHQDAGKPTRPHHALVSKKDSFARTQEALNQKSKGPVRTVPHNQRSTQVLANQRNERKAKLNQVFIENNNSEDEMLVEEQKDPFTKNKRSTLPGRSIDNYEKEIPNKKVIKTSDHHPKGKTVEAKKVPVRNSYGGEEVQKPKVPANKKPSVDLSYMTEFGRNSSLQKYVEKKTRMDETMKSNRNSSPVPSSKAMNIEKSPQAPTQKTQDKANAGQFKPPSSLARREDVVSNTREEKEMVSQKPAVKETKGLFETKNDLKPEVGSKDAGVKPEGAKISSILGGSSIFSQPKAEVSSEKAEKEEATSNKPPSDLFKTMKPGMSVSGASGDSKDQPPSKIPHVEPSDEKKEETRKAYVGSLFSTDIKDEKKAETAGEKTQEDNAKPTQLGLFKSGGSLFSGFNAGGSLFSNPKSENQGNTAADDKKEAPKVTSGLFGNNKTPEVNAGDGQKAEEKPKTGLFAQTSGTGLFAGLKTDNKTGLSPGGLFGNLSSVTGPKDSGESVKKDDPLAAFAKKPEVDEAKPKLLFSNLIEAKPAEAGADTKPKGLFSNAGGISGDLFKTNYSKIGGSGLFAGSGKDDKPTTGLFANLNNGNSSNEKTS